MNKLIMKQVDTLVWKGRMYVDDVKVGTSQGFALEVIQVADERFGVNNFSIERKCLKEVNL